MRIYIKISAAFNFSFCLLFLDCCKEYLGYLRLKNEENSAEGKKKSVNHGISNLTDRTSFNPDFTISLMDKY